MPKYTWLLVAALVGATASALYARSAVAPTPTTAAAPFALPDALETIATLEARVAVLEQRLEQNSNEDIAAIVPPEAAVRETADAPEDASVAQVSEREQLRALWRRDPQAARRKMLARNGLRDDEIDRIVTFEQERQVRDLDADWDLRRNMYLEGTLPTPRRDSYFEELRTVLGDESFERYLSAQGMSMSISSVMPGTAAEYSGLRAGDVIQNYNGTRVYSSGQLNRLTVAGERGEPVTIDVLRDGRTVTLSLPRGPIGIQTGRNRATGRP
ncbi:MAG: PDZ domain-containing protein [Pseudomonadota bacterium]